MTATTSPAPAVLTDSAPHNPIGDVIVLARRQLLRTIRQPFLLVPALIIPIFFLVVNLGALSNATSFFAIDNAANFFLPVSILFVVSNGGAGLAMVEDIESGYFDKLLLTPTNRLALLIGSMGGDFLLLVFQAVIVLALGPLFGAEFGLGIGGAALLILLAGLWGLAYSSIGYAIALTTGSVQATQSAFIVFFPFVFLTTSFLPLDALEGWMQTAARLNPVTYMLEALRMLLGPELILSDLLQGFAAVAAVGVLTIGWAMIALRRRVS